VSDDPKPLDMSIKEFWESWGFDEGLNMSDEEWTAHDAKVAAQRAADEANWKPSDATRSLESQGWPARAVRAAREADVTRESITRLAAVNFEASSIVVLAGDPGCGKTVAACHWAMHSRRFHNCTEFVRASTFAASSRYDQETRQRWYGAHALVLDDLGAEYLDAKGSFQVDLDELVDTFYGDERPLIVTTNLNGQAFKSRYGERVTDRIRECGKWLDIAASSMRRRA
jgi:DNA replication protein DnaC